MVMHEKNHSITNWETAKGKTQASGPPTSCNTSHDSTRQIAHQIRKHVLLFKHLFMYSTIILRTQIQ